VLKQSACLGHGADCGHKFVVHVVNVDEDAFSGAHLCGLQHGHHIAGRHRSQTARPTWVIEYFSAFRDIRDAVLKLHKHIGAMIDTETIAGAEVLVNPHAHTLTVPVSGWSPPSHAGQHRVVIGIK